MLGALIRGEPRSRLQVHVRRDLRESVGTVEYQGVAAILEERSPVWEKRKFGCVDAPRRTLAASSAGGN